MERCRPVSCALLVLALVGAVGAATAGGAQDEAAIPDRDITVLSFESMRYPPLARVANVQGLVVVRVTLDRGGKVTDAHALSGPSHLVSATVENLRKWRFEPNAENAAIIVYDYRIVGLCAHGEDSSQLVLEPPNLAIITACAFTVTAAPSEPASRSQGQPLK
jgi:TonB family protein